ncbi:Vesicle coat protein involved in Golgi to plasma membrane transport/Folliculin C-terminal domain containing protein, putative [Angomonas deanei]|uniref:Vesicle coat protein involved in Golgi to plasma membrane transport/Folliculin C-terminal domain containing protein, putative n=1 Tax=Angomonas deanei TaxID=59799 RepID=A0A7G2CHN1_9TRYP|nr:Vesicle coat protein involved in Golgi to plasma membrane transport/Folliculin C-terminal domain containing protein, putative [Angomonas deanei]
MVSANLVSGGVEKRYLPYIQSVAARTLTSYENESQTTVFSEEGSPVFGCFSFTLRDILARGEQRRFCIIIMHPDLTELMNGWELTSKIIQTLITSWYKRAKKRFCSEYDLLNNIETTREEARKTALRSLFEIISDADCFDYAAVWQETHAFFESVVPHFFAPLSPKESAVMSGEEVTSLIEEWRLISGGVSKINTEQLARQYPVVDHPARTVKPAVLWLMEFVHSPFNSDDKLNLLLEALFVGDQIVVSGQNALDCAELVVALSSLLPKCLVRNSIFAEDYEMPYRSRIISFSDTFLKNNRVVSFGEAEGAMDEIPPFNLSEIPASGIVHAEVQHRKLSKVTIVSKDGSEDTPVFSTLTTRIACQLAESADTILWSGKAGVAPEPLPTLELLQVSLRQTVEEYVARGRAYSALFSGQEISCNASALGIVDRTKAAQNLSFRLVLESLFGSSGDKTDHKIQNNSRFKLSNRNRQSVFSSSCPEDHDTLLFLGKG